MNERQILVTGATGYVGGRLVPLLLHKGFNVRCMVREPRRLTGRWNGEVQRSGQLEVIYGDVLQPASLTASLTNVDTAFYLIHSMGDGQKGFLEREKQSAIAFAKAAEECGVKHIIYLGGLGKKDGLTSAHLESRHLTGDLLRAGTVPVTEFRAAMIVGAGSASFEMLRHLTEKLPIMVCPRWIKTRTQPIFIEDVLSYLIAAIASQKSEGHVLDIGGPDILMYRDMMQVYADIRGLKRFIFTVPVLTPRLSSYWINMVTPIPSSIASPLVEGLRSETICENDDAQRLLPVPLTSFRASVEQALRETDDLQIPTHWTGAVRGEIPRLLDTSHLPAGGHGLIRDVQEVKTRASVGRLQRAISRVGGRVGWYYGNWLWEIRGALDKLIGGVGVRRGRRHPEEIVIGDAIDFWRVEDCRPNRLLLRAEMKVPGRAWLEFCVREESEGNNTLVQTAYYFPGSIWGYIYWYALLPLHYFVFSGMANKLVYWAEHAE